MKKPTAIFFDLDDTIVSCPGGNYLELWKHAIAKHLNNIKQITTEQLFEEIRRVANVFWSNPIQAKQGRLFIKEARQGFVKRALENLDFANDDLALEIANYYHQKKAFETELFDGAIDTLKFFQQENIPMALITNGGADVQRYKVKRHKLEQFFDLIIIEGEFGFGKPEKEVYIYALERLQSNPESTWMVGDHLKWEVQTPQEFGIFSIWHDAHKEGLDEQQNIKPDKIVHRISELKDFYLEL